MTSQVLPSFYHSRCYFTNNIVFFQVTVQLRDVNDRTPVFQFLDYQSEVTEDSPVGSTVTTMQATDLDSAENTVVIYTSDLLALFYK